MQNNFLKMLLKKKRHKTGAKNAKWQHRNAKTATNSHIKQSDKKPKQRDAERWQGDTTRLQRDAQVPRWDSTQPQSLVSPPALSSNVGGSEARRDVHTLTSDHLWFTLSPHSISISRYQLHISVNQPSNNEPQIYHGKKKKYRCHPARHLLLTVHLKSLDLCVWDVDCLRLRGGLWAAHYISN